MKISFIISLIIIFSNGLFSQKEFLMEIGTGKIPNSKYNKIIILDQRMDTSNLGIVQVGMFNKKTRVITRVPLKIQLSSIFNNLITNNAKEGQLVIQIRQLMFAEFTGAVSEKGYCYVRANSYAKNEDGKYYKVAEIDTVGLTKGLDVTNGLLRYGEGLLHGFITRSILKESIKTDNLWDLNELISIDSIEKRNIKVYNVSKYEDGMYLTYDSFKNQVPDKKVIVERKNGKIDYVYYKEGRYEIEVKGGDCFALVDGGIPYIVTDYAVHKLKFENDNFYFTGRIKESAPYGEIVAASALFGALGGLIVACGDRPSSDKYSIMLDHKTGGFITLQKVKDK